MKKKNGIVSLISGINYKEIGILYALLLLWIICIITNIRFRRLDVFLNIFRQASFVGIAAIGMTFCIISRNFDLSVGSMLAFLSIITVSIMGKTGLLFGVLLILCAGILCGLVNGILVAKVRIPAFIATLGMLFIYRAAAFIWSNGSPVRFQKPWFTVLGNGDIAGIPIPFIFFILLTSLGIFILRKTPLGRYVLAIGNSEKASTISGINVARIKIIIFAMVGFFTAFSAILMSSRLWSANPGMKDGFEFDVIAATVLGGTSLKGGKGSVFNTFIAAIFFASLTSAMNLFRVESFVQEVIKGIILLFAFSMTGIRNYLEEVLRKKKIK